MIDVQLHLCFFSVKCAAMTLDLFRCSWCSYRFAFVLLLSYNYGFFPLFIEQFWLFFCSVVLCRQLWLCFCSGVQCEATFMPLFRCSLFSYNYAFIQMFCTQAYALFRFSVCSYIYAFLISLVCSYIDAHVLCAATTMLCSGVQCAATTIAVGTTKFCRKGKILL